MVSDFAKIEKKWHQEWEKAGLFETALSKKKKKFYCLEMFPYPSAEGLHVGHAFNYVIGDICARFKRMQGCNVLYPMGYDSLGLPAENAAIKAGEHPKKYTEKAIANFINQQKLLGLSYDWKRMIVTLEPDYYKWNQFFFLKFFENNLVYKKKAAANFCEKCNTVLANEQVHSGKCWRHPDTDVQIKSLEQWFIKTTAYAEELLEGLEKLEWPEKIKAMQRNWIGKSHGIDIDFKINNEGWKIFTTRPDTIFGVTFMVVSAQHPRLMELVTKEQKQEVEEFLKKIKSTSEKDSLELEKEGAFTGSYAVNPVTNEKVPVYTGNFVIAEYGSGMVMAVPAHDQRDFEFAKKYSIQIKIVIQPKGSHLEELSEAFVEEGILADSKEFNGINSKEAIEKISDFIEKKHFGKRTLNYKLRDWLISRQRYWGTPIPIIYCEKCGIVPVPEKDLPVLLPEKVEFGTGNPLATSKSFLDVKCPKCKGNAKRETDTMDTFVDSSWYFLRFADSKNKKKPFEKSIAEYWLPVDQYIGGAEHACMHLIYARFFTKALRDLKFLNFSEPFTKLFNQGMLHGSDGFVMSKSRGNVINPIEMIEKYGADTLRIYLISSASPDRDFTWSSEGLEGSSKFVKKIFEYFSKAKAGKSSARSESKINKAIKEISSDIENFEYNLAVIKIRSLFDSLSETESKETLASFLKLFSVFCPHISEELWQKFGNKGFISTAEWPVADEKKINEKFEQEEKALEKLVEDINNVSKILKTKGKAAQKVFIYCIPPEKDFLLENLSLIQAKTGLEAEVFAVNDRQKHDPENKAGKAKPGKPALFME
ncbi:MAG TPA: leucine--tRNA ligase [archaeon]|nr:leucine--tRNA ligase [archaeon]